MFGILNHLKSNCNIFFLLLCLLICRSVFLQNERGNFLLQTLLALGLIFAFVPFVAKQMAGRNIDARMFTTTKQVEHAQSAAGIFIRENANNLPFETTVISGNDFADTLEAYGLPLGFVPKTALGQDIRLIIYKSPLGVSANLELSGGKLNHFQQAELMRRIGFYAYETDTPDVINIAIELQEIYSDIVRRNEPNLDNSAFLADLDMGGFSLNNVGNLFAIRGEFETAQFNTLTITGTETGKKEKNNIQNILSDKIVFQTQTGEAALTLSRGTLYTNNTNTKTVSMFGNTGNFTSLNASAYELSMTAGRTSFTGPAKWDVRGSVISTNITFTTDLLNISSVLLATRGQDVYVDEETLEYSTKSGIETDVLHTSHITLRDQISSALTNGQDGATILDIRPAGTSLLPDVYISSINNDGFQIIDAPSDDNDKTTACKDIITGIDGVYNKNSLSQYLVCQFLYWQQLEKRINIKECLMAGRSDCM